MRTAPLLLLAALPIAAACSSSTPSSVASAGTDSIADVTYLTGEATRDQYGFVQPYVNTDILVGDEDAFSPNFTMRGLVTFNMKAVPQKATISAATLQLAQCDIVGSPYSTLGSILVDHVPVMTHLDTASYDTTATNAAIATLATDSTLGLKTAAVTSSVAADRAAGDTLVQFRLHFSAADGNNNGVNDYAAFSADSALTTLCTPGIQAHRPLLIVTFQ
ncbi:MAG TPA: hypothetical protein VNW46_14615 [Gemmatimonadaceae bacterium]|jgi:hypothetical protein|nr:hypothetical protein [Gemmatimonadaceae bacterium]